MDEGFQPIRSSQTNDITAVGNHTAAPISNHEPEHPLVEVDPVAGAQALRIHVECRKRPGLLENLVAALEATGLLLLEANISVHEDVVNLDAVALQEGELPLTVDAAVLRSSLLDIIANADNMEPNNIDACSPPP